MHVLVWYENDYDINHFMVLSYSQDENKLYEIKKLFDGVEEIKGWRLQKGYLKALRQDLGIDIPEYGEIDVLKVDEQKDLS